MLDDYGPDHEQTTFRFPIAERKVVLVQRYYLALLRFSFTDQYSADVRFDDVRLAHVSDTKQQTQLSVSLTDNRVFTEQECFRTLLGTRELSEDEPGHQGLNDDAEAGLTHHNEDRFRTLRVCSTATVSDRLLGLDREKQRGREVVHLFDARRRSSLSIAVFVMRFATRIVGKVTVGETDEPPRESEYHPAEDEREDEIQEIPAPFDVDKGCKDVRHVALSSFFDVRARHIALAIFVN